MNAEVLQQLSGAPDLHALTKGVLQLCQPFGAVHSFRLVHNRRAARIACFVELESAKQQPALARALGTRSAGGPICIEIPVRADFGA